MQKLTSTSDTVSLLTRERSRTDVRETVAEIVASVRDNGDSAICDYSRKFDGVDTGSAPRIINRDELAAYVEATSGTLTELQRKAIDTAVDNVTFAATKSQPKSWRDVAPQGHTIGEEFTAFTRVACYVPQGSFPLVSTAIHTAAIAKSCGVEEIVMITSPSNDDLNIAVAYAAFQSGVTEILYAGGAQGIAACAYGTQSVKRVDFICGPGNQYVAEAKRQVFGDVGIDMVAGPSEVFVVADDTADAYAVACDLVAQAEHGSGLETSVLLSPSDEVIEAVAHELEKIKPMIGDNSGFANVWDKSLFLIKTSSVEEAIKVVNGCAPEHVEVITADAAKDAAQIVNAGAVFIGGLSAEPLGDFVAGPSHVLPTDSSARFSSGLSSASFFRRRSILEFTQESYDQLAPLAYEFGLMEGLTGHALSSVARLPENVRPTPTQGDK